MGVKGWGEYLLKSCCVEALSKANYHIKSQSLKTVVGKYSFSDFYYVWFSDKKIFAVSIPKNTRVTRKAVVDINRRQMYAVMPL